MSRFAIIGAGIAGLSCARPLIDAGHTVRLFDKGRGPGGRMSTRRVSFDDTMLRFDHGAQYFTARDAAFIAEVDRWVEAGYAAPWLPAGPDAFVGTPAMNAPVKALAGETDVRFAERIDAIGFDCDRWGLIGQIPDDEEAFDAVVVAIPAEQAAALLEPHMPDIARIAGDTHSQPCWTVMAHFDAPLELPDTIRDQGPIGWAARNNAKPGRDPQECWVIQASPEWSAANIENETESVAAALLAALSAERSDPLPEPAYVTAHRWRFAMSGAADGPYWDAKKKIGACGDWTRGPRIEDAWLSGKMLAERILG